MQSLHGRTWLAVRGKTADQICSDLELRAGMAVTRPRHFALEDGDLPFTFAKLRQEFIAKSQADDAGDLLLDPIFEIPIEMVQRTVGYRPDAPSRAFDGRFVLLEAINPTLMQRLFGG